jgi:hypothetical protein
MKDIELYEQVGSATLSIEATHKSESYQEAEVYTKTANGEDNICE